MKLVEVKKSLLNQPNINRKYYIIVDTKDEKDEDKINQIIDEKAVAKAEREIAFQYMAHNINWEIIEDDSIKRDLMYREAINILLEYDESLKKKMRLYEQLESVLGYDIIDYKVEDGEVSILEDKKGWLKINI